MGETKEKKCAEMSVLNLMGVLTHRMIIKAAPSYQLVIWTPRTSNCPGESPHARSFGFSACNNVFDLTRRFASHCSAQKFSGSEGVRSQCAYVHFSVYHGTINSSPFTANLNYLLHKVGNAPFVQNPIDYIRGL